jgi:hypothetical protein
MAPPPAPSTSGGGDNGATGDRGDSGDFRQIICVVDGQTFRVRSTNECYQVSRHRSSGNENADGGDDRAPQAHRPRARHRHMVAGGSYRYNSGDAPQPRILYYRPASPAAVMQAERRRREAQYGYGDSYGFSGGYDMHGYDAGYVYGMQQGYGGSQGCDCRRKHVRKVRHGRRHAIGYSQQFEQGYGFDYDSGVSSQNGLIMMRDGGY